MMIAETVHIPTINGAASFRPPDWNFAYPSRADYFARIASYVTRHHLSGICELDLATMRWREHWQSK